MLKRFKKLRITIKMFFLRHKLSSDKASFNLILDTLTVEDWDKLD